MKSVKVEFTQEEAQVLVQLLDLSVKSGGLQVAQAALVISNKMNLAFPVEEPKEDKK